MRDRALVAGVGNALRGDDGFGVAVLRELERDSRLIERGDVDFYETGIAGIGLVQKLMEGYRVLVIVDAVARGASPGELFVFQPERGATGGKNDENVDPHLANPEGVIRLARSLGVLPEEVWIVGCQAADCDELTMELSPEVRRAVPEAADRVRRLLSGTLDPELDPVTSVDEILQVLYWLRGESLAPDATAHELARFLSIPAAAIAAALPRMEAMGLVEEEPPSSARYHLTPLGVVEGGRRFQDEFADWTKTGHGECNDPDCECQRTGDPADCRRA